jgi:hypothetical protein
MKMQEFHDGGAGESEIFVEIDNARLMRIASPIFEQNRL